MHVNINFDKKTLGLKLTIWQALLLNYLKKKTFLPNFQNQTNMWGKKVSGLLQRNFWKRYEHCFLKHETNLLDKYLKKKENLTLGKGFPAHQPISSVILYVIKERKKKLFSEKSWFYKTCAFRSLIFLILEFEFAKLSFWIFFENFFRCSALDNSNKIFHLLIPVPNILKQLFQRFTPGLRSEKNTPKNFPYVLTRIIWGERFQILQKGFVIKF